MYHKISAVNLNSKTKGHYVSPRLFSNHLKLLKVLGYQTCRLEDVQSEQTRPKRAIVITFDDGYRDFYENALPSLEANGFQSTVFLVANQIGGTNAWDVEIGDVSENLMSRSEILDAKKRGTQFGSHTLDHVDLADVSLEEAERQISVSKLKLAEVVGSEIQTFCYPYGRKTPEVMNLVQRSGYRVACSTEKGINDSSSNPYALRRINVRRDTYTSVLLMKLLRTHK